MKKIIALAYSLLFLVAISPSWASELKSNVIILIDYSNSYYYDARLKKIEKNISKIATAIAKAKTGAQKHQWLYLLRLDCGYYGNPISGRGRRG